MSSRIRRKLGALAVDGFFGGLARAGRLHPRARPERHGVEVIRDVAYLDSGLDEHRLDVYRPANRTGPLPAVIYMHGGGFRILSKDTHWLMGLAFAKRGYVVFNINYRLAPQHPFPAAVEDCCTALEWVLDNAERYGGDLERLVYAGESAGANLATTLAWLGVNERSEPFAQRVWARDPHPKAVVAFCGFLQISDARRLARRRPMPVWVVDRLDEVGHSYLDVAELDDPATLELADPLVLIENGTASRVLPPFFAPVGTKDPVLDDTRRLKAALDERGVDCEDRYYEGEVHAFMAMVFRKNAVQCWRDTFEFLDRHL